jgi:ATP-dependent protease ClpP protease subunit
MTADEAKEYGLVDRCSQPQEEPRRSVAGS